MGRLAESTWQLDGESRRSRAHTDAPVPDRTRLFEDMAASMTAQESLEIWDRVFRESGHSVT
jgi:hypothetical protein